MYSYVVPATHDHVQAVASAGLRDQDLAEVEALGRDPEKALFESFTASFPNVFAKIDRGRPVAIFGAAPHAGTERLHGCPWLLGTSEVFQHDVVRAVRQGRLWVDHINGIYPVLWNFVDERNTASIRWLKFMGFIFDGVSEQMNGVRFLRFFRCA